MKLRRYASLAGAMLNSSVRRPAAPWKVTWAVTYLCNHSCRHCGIWRRTPSGEMGIKEIRRFFEQNPQIRWLDLTGGEPTTRNDFPEIVKAATEMLPRLVLLHFPTNGALGDRAVAAAEAALAHRPPQLILTVSLDGPPTLHDEIRGSAGAWERAMETFNRLRQLPGVRPVLGMTLTAENAGSAEACFEAARSALHGHLDPGEMHFNLAHRSAHYYDNADMELPDWDLVSEELARFQARLGPSLQPTALLERAFRELVPDYLATGTSPVECGALSASVFVDPHGVIYPCITEDRPLASLRELDYSLAAVFDATVEARAEVAASRCVGCWAPCEAFPSLMSAPVDSGRALVRSFRP
ncbi:MAG: radical SAM protein [Proteobacteria bacterium]|nr:radical SAM protein [Pseudomonadota bacterium]